MSVSDFLKDLPIHNSENFTKLNSSDGYARSTASTTTSRQRATVYVPTVDHPSEQVRLVTAPDPSRDSSEN